MRTDDVILKAVDDAFGIVQRPRKFTVEDGDPECMDHDRLLHSRTPEFTLSLRLISDGAANDFLAYCSNSQRHAVHSLFSYIKENRAEQIGDIWCGEEINECITLWGKSDWQVLER